jgi:hypothetical protein
LLGDLPFFFRPDGQDLDRSVISMDFQDLFAGLLILPAVHRDAEPFEPLAASFADRGGIHADASGKDHGLDPAKDGEVGAKVLFDAVAVELQGQIGK